MSNKPKQPQQPIVPKPIDRVGHHLDALTDDRFVDLMSSLCGIPSKPKAGGK
ncbi:hypothetical protein [Pseudomonas sp. PDM25]|uniref:hypothetical protein n=1 Tax=Pseudomonas sp. PDM25 TaxID=2854772 RepID=UPI001C45F48D|nr:hypothetical protein [Pseudomonas sp. PDM25]MBV7514489.1 hypothetical protein [Pseudomonas sp. PDM25]